MDVVVELARELIARPSLTPDDAGCQALIGKRLERLGFDLEPMPFGDVTNLWARLGDRSPLLVFAGHTDVVPTGPAEEWRNAPFDAHIEDGVLYGRGAADMKGSVAAMVCALEEWRAAGGTPAGSVALLITSDEEGKAVDGTRKVVDALMARGEKMDWCLVGEPSSAQQVGDRIRIGRRGSLNGSLTVRGIQGHVAFPQLARNPIHTSASVLARLVTERWDEGNDAFPPTSFQISNLNAGTGATNVIPGSLTADFNLRFSTELEVTDIQARVESMLRREQLDFHIDWELSGPPFLSQPGPLTAAVNAAVNSVAGIVPRQSTGGGTSDGRFIAETGAEIVELGPVNATIHKIDECIDIAQLIQLKEIFRSILCRLLD